MSDTTSIREITIENEKFEARCKDPHGFWTVKHTSMNKGATPEEIKGQFTSLTEAQKAINAVVAKKLKKDPETLVQEVVNPQADKE